MKIGKYLHFRGGESLEIFMDELVLWNLLITPKIEVYLPLLKLRPQVINIQIRKTKKISGINSNYTQILITLIRK